MHGMRIIFLCIFFSFLILPSIVFTASDQGADEKGTPYASEDVMIIEGMSDAEKRLDEIELRKKGLAEKKDRLIKDREQLYADVDKKRMVKTQAEFDAFKKRISELEKQIKQFNDEVKTLTEEEQRLIDLVNKVQEAQ